MAAIAQQIIGFIVVFAAIAVIFVTLERLWPANRGWRLFRPGFRTDLLYWLFTPLVTRTITRVVLAVLITGVLALLGSTLTLEQLKYGWGPVGNLPWGLQAVLILLLADFMGYWAHRLHHTTRLWRFHTIHHTPKQVDWLMAVRVHPVNDLVATIIRATPLLALGFAPAAVAALVPLFAFLGLYDHANVRWDYGPLRGIIVSPAFHRWHHTGEEQGRNCNYGGLLAIWDRAFGTYYFPKRAPERFGVDEDVPDGLVGQMLYPFRRQKA